MAMIQDMSLINTTLLQQATAATQQPFDDVQERINTYLGLAAEAAQSAGDDPLTGILGTAVSALAGGAVGSMFSTPATASSITTPSGSPGWQGYETPQTNLRGVPKGGLNQSYYAPWDTFNEYGQKGIY